MPVTILMKRPNFARLEVDVGGQAIVSILDGAKAWSTKPGSASFDEISQEGLAGLMSALLNGITEIGRPLESYKETGDPIELIGTEREGNRDLYKLKVIRRGGDSMNVFLDKVNFLKVKQSEIYKELDLDTYYGDYKAVGDVVLPHYLEHRAIGNQTYSKIKIEKFELNTDIEDSRFKRR